MHIFNKQVPLFSLYSSAFTIQLQYKSGFLLQNSTNKKIPHPWRT